MLLGYVGIERCGSLEAVHFNNKDVSGASAAGVYVILLFTETSAPLSHSVAFLLLKLLNLSFNSKDKTSICTFSFKTSLPFMIQFSFMLLDINYP